VCFPTKNRAGTCDHFTNKDERLKTPNEAQEHKWNAKVVLLVVNEVAQELKCVKGGFKLCKEEMKKEKENATATL